MSLLAKILTSVQGQTTAFVLKFLEDPHQLCSGSVLKAHSRWGSGNSYVVLGYQTWVSCAQGQLGQYCIPVPSLFRSCFWKSLALYTWGYSSPRPQSAPQLRCTRDRVSSRNQTFCLSPLQGQMLCVYCWPEQDTGSLLLCLLGFQMLNIWGTLWTFSCTAMGL